MASREEYVVKFLSFCFRNKALREKKRFRDEPTRMVHLSLTFSRTLGNAFRGIGSARLFFLTRGGTGRGALTAAAAASAAAFASPCRASMGAFIVDRGSVSSDSSSEEGAVEGTIPYVAYL